METVKPAGMVWPSNVAPPSGTMRGRRDMTPKERRRDSFTTPVRYGRRSNTVSSILAFGSGNAASNSAVSFAYMLGFLITSYTPVVNPLPVVSAAAARMP